MFVHLHVAAWALAFISFGFAWALYWYKKDKPAAFFHWVTRVLLASIAVTGIILVYRYITRDMMGDFGPELVVKTLSGLWAVVMMEWILYRLKRGGVFKGFVVQLVVMVAIALILGFGRLPWGFYP